MKIEEMRMNKETAAQWLLYQKMLPIHWDDDSAETIGVRKLCESQIAKAYDMGIEALKHNSLDMHRNVLDDSIAINGEKIKKVICMEECSELIQAVSKDIRGKLDIDNLTEEIADVLICIEMLKIIHRIKDENIQAWIDYKVDRQQQRDREIVNSIK